MPSNTREQRVGSIFFWKKRRATFICELSIADPELRTSNYPGSLNASIEVLKPAKPALTEWASVYRSQTALHSIIGPLSRSRAAQAKDQPLLLCFRLAPVSSRKTR